MRTIQALLAAATVAGVSATTILGIVGSSGSQVLFEAPATEGLQTSSMDGVTLISAPTPESAAYCPKSAGLQGSGTVVTTTHNWLLGNSYHFAHVTGQAVLTGGGGVIGNSQALYGLQCTAPGSQTWVAQGFCGPSQTKPCAVALKSNLFIGVQSYMSQSTTTPLDMASTNGTMLCSCMSTDGSNWYGLEDSHPLSLHKVTFDSAANTLAATKLSVTGPGANFVGETGSPIPSCPCTWPDDESSNLRGGNVGATGMLHVVDTTSAEGDFGFISIDLDSGVSTRQNIDRFEPLNAAFMDGTKLGTFEKTSGGATMLVERDMAQGGKVVTDAKMQGSVSCLGCNTDPFIAAWPYKA